MLTRSLAHPSLGAHPSRSRLIGHASHNHASRASGQRVQAVRQPFYDREFEKDQLDRALKRQPREILLVLGPRNCGKTAIFQSFLEGRRNGLYVDCRGIDTRTPTTFITGLLKALLPMLPAGDMQKNVKELLIAFPAGLKFSKQGVTWSPGTLLKALFGQRQASNDGLNEVFDTLKEIFVAWNKEEEAAKNKYPETRWPVLVIDEANAIMSWADTYPEELNNLLGFFVKMTKQEGLCHVVMATSEFGFQTWLDKFVGAQFWRPQVIGDFTESDARQFLFQLLAGVSNGGNSIDKDDKAWAAVYEVCGGNAGALARLAATLPENPAGDDWDIALRELWQVELEKVARLLLGGEGYAAVHYAAAALALLDSQQAGNAVSLPVMEALLGRYVDGAASARKASTLGAAVLKCLVQANALSVRPPSAWARDIPAEAFGNRSLVTAPSTMDLYCLRLIRPELEEVLEEHNSAQKAKQADTLQVGASPSGSPGADSPGKDADGGVKE